MFNITNILRDICALTHVFGSFVVKIVLHQSIWVGLFAVLAFKICQKTNIFVCTLILLAKLDIFC